MVSRTGAAAKDILATIGETPLVRLQSCVPESGAEIWLKLEYFNPTGSMKDRMGLSMIEGAERDTTGVSRLRCRFSSGYSCSTLAIWVRRTRSSNVAPFWEAADEEFPRSFGCLPRSFKQEPTEGWRVLGAG